MENYITKKSKGRPTGSKAEKTRELTKRQRWTVEEWEEVEIVAFAARKTPSAFIRAATLQFCREKAV